VGGYAIFEKAYFARSVSFRDARFETLYLDDVQWPETNYMALRYTNAPFMANLLRLESVDFQNIRDIGGNRFDQSPEQLKESETNLVNMFRAKAPYSFEVYSKLEDYFNREGEPALANQVFIEAKEREGDEATGWAKFANWFLRVTVGYGRIPLLAFGESLLWIVVVGLLCRFFTIIKETKEAPSVPLALLYSLGLFLPLVDLKVDDILELKDKKSGFRYVLGFGKILGWILVPLWTAAVAGLVK
jgi:hypothetical protein